MYRLELASSCFDRPTAVPTMATDVATSLVFGPSTTTPRRPSHDGEGAAIDRFLGEYRGTTTTSCLLLVVLTSVLLVLTNILSNKNVDVWNLNLTEL